MLIVRVCVGTYCYLQGGEELAKWKFYLPEILKDKVTFLGSACLGCNNDNAKPPYAKVGEVLIENATPQKVVNEIYNQLGINPE